MTVLSQLALGKIGFLNCIPYYSGWQDKTLEFKESHPMQVNEWMSSGEIQAAPISSLEYLMHQDDYLILNPFCIATEEYSQSVLLFSKKPIEKLNGESIALTEQSLSSANLLKLILKEIHGFENSYETMPSSPEEMLKKHDAALLIGNDALFCQPKRFIYKYDLGKLWWDWKKKPFVFALWAVRKEFARENGEWVKNLKKSISENLENNLQNLEKCIQVEYDVDSSNKHFPKIYSYLKSLKYEMNEEMIESLNIYFESIYQLGLAPEPKPLEFFEK